METRQGKSLAIRFAYGARKHAHTQVAICLIVAVFMTGCSTVVQSIGSAISRPTSPELIPVEQLDEYESIHALIDENYARRYEVSYSASGRGRLLEPFVNARTYCQRQQGEWIRVETISGPHLLYEPTADYERAHRDDYEKDVAAVFGTFHCQRQGAPVWGVLIDHNGGGEFSPEGRIGHTTMRLTPMTPDDIAVAQAEAEARRQEDARRIAARDAERAQRAQAQAERAREERQRIESAAATFREGISLGTETHCGMVVQMRESLVEVQTIEGQRWFRLNQLYPPAMMGCRFFNGQYVEP